MINTGVFSNENDFDSTKLEVVNMLRDIKNEDNTYNLYDHLQKLFDVKMLLQDDEKFLDLFEDISYRIKNNGYYIEDNHKENNIKTYLEYFVKSNLNKKKLLEPLVKKDGDEITPVTNVGYVPDYHNIFQSLSWCGIGLGEKESYLLTLSIRNLISEKNLQSGTFWGKIFGKDKDYYIVETPPTEQINGNILFYINLYLR